MFLASHGKFKRLEHSSNKMVDVDVSVSENSMVQVASSLGGESLEWVAQLERPNVTSTPTRGSLRPA